MSHEGATASCKDMIPPTSHEDAASLLVPSPATCESARVRVSHARGAEVSGVVVVVVVVVGVVVGEDASVVVSVGVGVRVVGGGLSLVLRSSRVVVARVSFVACAPGPDSL